jgi:hypothetical protein
LGLHDGMVPFLKVLMISLGGLGKKGCLLGLQLGKGVQEVMAEENGVDDSDDCVSIGQWHFSIRSPPCEYD